MHAAVHANSRTGLRAYREKTRAELTRYRGRVTIAPRYRVGPAPVVVVVSKAARARARVLPTFDKAETYGMRESRWKHPFVVTGAVGRCMYRVWDVEQRARSPSRQGPPVG